MLGRHSQSTPRPSTRCASNHFRHSPRFDFSENTIDNAVMYKADVQTDGQIRACFLHGFSGLSGLVSSVVGRLKPAHPQLYFDPTHHGTERQIGTSCFGGFPSS